MVLVCEYGYKETVIENTGGNFDGIINNAMTKLSDSYGLPEEVINKHNKDPTPSKDESERELINPELTECTLKSSAFEKLRDMDKKNKHQQSLDDFDQKDRLMTTR